MTPKLLIAGALALTLSARAVAAPFEGQFDLICKGTIFQDGKAGGDWNPRFAVDLDRQLYCPIMTDRCGRAVEISQITPDVLVLRDTQKPGLPRMVLSVRSDTDVAKLEMHGREGVKLFSQSTCKRGQYTPIP